MTKTLADMTPEELAQCKGMWCEDKHGPLCIYMGDDQVWEELGICTYPASAIAMRAKLENLIPRPDLPRAWTPDGTPPAGEWAYANPSDKERMHVRLPDKNTTHRRFVGEWEEA